MLTAFARRLLRRPVTPTVACAATSGKESPAGLRALREGLRYAWSEPVVRAMLLVIATLNVAVIGPILVGGACSP